MRAATIRAPQSFTKMAHESLRIRPMSMQTPCCRFTARSPPCGAARQKPRRLRRRSPPLPASRPPVSARRARSAGVEQRAAGCAPGPRRGTRRRSPSSPRSPSFSAQPRLALEQVVIDAGGQQGGLALVEGWPSRRPRRARRGPRDSTAGSAGSPRDSGARPGRSSRERPLALVVQRQAALAVQQKAVVADGPGRAGPTAGLARVAARQRAHAGPGSSAPAREVRDAGSQLHEAAVAVDVGDVVASVARHPGAHGEQLLGQRASGRPTGRPARGPRPVWRRPRPGCRRGGSRSWGSARPAPRRRPPRSRGRRRAAPRRRSATAARAARRAA